MIPAYYRGWMAGNRRNGPFGIEIELSSERAGLSVQGKLTEYPWPAPRTWWRSPAMRPGGEPG
jgi:hypothetical protein